MTVKEYDLANWMGLDGVRLTHCSTTMANTIVWAATWDNKASGTLPWSQMYALKSCGDPVLSASMQHQGKATPSASMDPYTHALATMGSDPDTGVRDPSPYWQMQQYGLLATSLVALPDKYGTFKAQGTGGAYSGSIPVIVDGVCYWVEIGPSSVMPRCVRQVLVEAGFSFV